MCGPTLGLGLGEQIAFSCRYYTLRRPKLSGLACRSHTQGLRYRGERLLIPRLNPWGRLAGLDYSTAAPHADSPGGESTLFSSFYWKHLSQTDRIKKYSQTKSKPSAAGDWLPAKLALQLFSPLSLVFACCYHYVTVTTAGDLKSR